jgi:hypothetical protein
LNVVKNIKKKSIKVKSGKTKLSQEIVHLLQKSKIDLQASLYLKQKFKNRIEPTLFFDVA